MWLRTQTIDAGLQVDEPRVDLASISIERLHGFLVLGDASREPGLETRDRLPRRIELIDGLSQLSGQLAQLLIGRFNFVSQRGGLRQGRVVLADGGLELLQRTVDLGQ